MTFFSPFSNVYQVGLSAENGYATSLARFAADLGPLFGIASKKIESVLPRGVKFGPGWVGENKIEQPRLSFSKKQVSSNSLSDNYSSRLLLPTASGSTSIAASRSPLQGKEDAEPETVRGPISQNDSTYTPAHQFQQRSLLHSGIKGSISDHSPQPRLVVQPMSENTSVPFQPQGMVSGSSSTMWRMPKPIKFADSSENAMVMVSHGVITNARLQQKPDNEQDFLPFPPDLNVRFPAPGSPSSSLPIGSPQRPDLALQL
ncbi:uncharacterized protein LOC120145910 [Hibiscus syriacus]|uniref:uncharacterized protein LOC120145910 n=1 Tax=Hibiscus syriacus TaxID=106335 RepID=UPI0019247789|nr:uncharacterized protein LOC120145910 [Hibiscus syriacus]